jgi:TPR repeat protein
MRIRPTLWLLSFLFVAHPAAAGLDEGLSAYQRKDWANAARELRPLADKEIPAAQARLGFMLFNGLGVERNDTEALKLLNAAGSAGEAIAQHTLGYAYFLGRSVPKDPTMALVWYGRAAAQDLPESNHALGDIHFNGLGIGKDEAKGLEYYKIAADKDFAPALEKLAELSWNGHAMPADRGKAVEYARRAAQANRPGAQFLLGMASLTGTGTDKRPAEAANWFRRAAEQGHAPSQHNLGLMCYRGDGVTKSAIEAYVWSALAADRAAANLKAKYEKDRDTIAAVLSPADLDQARKRVAAWRATAPAAPSVSGRSPAPPAVAAPIPAPPPQTNNAPSGPATSTAPAETMPQKGRTSTGSGIVVARDGAVLTNAHVVEQCRTITIKPQDGPPVVASLAAKDAGNDLALLKTSLRLPEIARFREDRPLRSGDTVVVAGFPLSSLLSREANITAGIISAMAGLRGDTRHYQITAPVQKGNSGGPLVDSSGNVIGIVSSKLNAMKVAGQYGDLPQNINFAIKSELARKFLDTYSVAYETAPAKVEMSTADVGERIKRVTVFIECRVN